MKYITTVDEQEFVIEIDRDDEIKVNQQTYHIDFEQLSDRGLTSLLLNNMSHEALVVEKEEHWEVLIAGEIYQVVVQDEWAHLMAQARKASGADSGDIVIKSPMPGIIVNMPASVGDTIHKGQTIVILESMKMENELKAPRDGVVSRINVEAGTSVEKGQALVVIADPHDENTESA